MKLTPTPGSVSGRRVDKAGDPLDGLINLFDLSLVLAVGLLLAALSSIGATGLIVPQGTKTTPLEEQPPSSGQQAQGQGQEVGKVYRLSDGRYVFAPSGAAAGGGASGTTGSTSGTTGATSGASPGTAGSSPGTTGSTQPPASTTTSPAAPLPTTD